MSAPIWKDYYVDLGTAGSVYYRILQDGATVYQGRSVLRPGQSTNTVRINDICADYMPAQAPSFVNGTVIAVGNAVFVVQTSADGSTGWADVATVEFSANWSYDYNSQAGWPLSYPIKDTIDPRQILLIPVNSPDMQAVVIHYADGSTSTLWVAVKVVPDFNNDFNGDFAITGRDMSSGIIAVDLSQYPGASYVTVGDETYTIDAGSCSRYAVYYLNAYGGWDSLVLEGNDKRTDQITRHEVVLDYDNRTESARGRRNYLNEITWNVQLVTGWLDDVQAGRMHNLLESTDVYLHDLSGIYGIRPVVLTDTAAEYRTFRNNGNRLVNYTFTARVAQDFIRR